MTEAHLKTGGEPLDFQNKLEVTNKINPDCYERFQELKIRRRHRYIVFKLGAEEVEVETVGGRKTTYEEMKRDLPFAECRWCVYDQDLKTADGRLTSKLWFISWFPHGSSTHSKMAYASAKGKFRESIEGVFDMQVASNEELDSSLGLEEEAADEDDGFDF